MLEEVITSNMSWRYDQSIYVGAYNMSSFAITCPHADFRTWGISSQTIASVGTDLAASGVDDGLW